MNSQWPGLYIDVWSESSQAKSQYRWGGAHQFPLLSKELFLVVAAGSGHICVWGRICPLKGYLCINRSSYIETHRYPFLRACESGRDKLCRGGGR